MKENDGNFVEFVGTAGGMAGAKGIGDTAGYAK